MKNINKKRGFTIVELIVVIAVVAILAAVLIPTFVGLVNKANITADQAAVKQMNTILAADGVAEPTTPEELFNVLAENGLSAKDYTPLASNKYFFWDSKLNQVIYTDSDYEILYPENLKDSNRNNWISLSGKIATPDVSTVVSAGATSVSVTDGKQLAAVLQAIEDKNPLTTAVTEIVLPSEVNLMGADVMIAKLDQPLTFKGAEGGTAIKGLVVNDAARFDEKNGSGLERNYNAGLIASTTKDVTFENIVLENSVVGDWTVDISSAFVGAANGGVVTFKNVDLKNTTVRGMMKVGAYVGTIQKGAKVVIDGDCDATDVTVEAAVGLAGGIFGYAHMGIVEVTTPANFDDVTVRLNKITEGYYITDKDGKVYGIDLENDLSVGGTRIVTVNGVKEDTGLYRYFESTAKYGFVNGLKGDTDVREASQFEGTLYGADDKNDKAIIAYGAKAVNDAAELAELKVNVD